MSETTYSINQIAVVTGGQLILNCPGQSEIRNLLTDSRRVLVAESALFFAIKGERHDGHKFIADLFNQGVRNFIVSEFTDEFKDLKANFVVVDEALKAMQQLTAHHRLNR